MNYVLIITIRTLLVTYRNAERYKPEGTTKSTQRCLEERVKMIQGSWGEGIDKGKKYQVCI